MDSTINLGHIISLLGYLVTTVAAAGAIGVRLNRVERDIERLLGLLEKQGRLEERIRACEAALHNRRDYDHERD